MANTIKTFSIYVNKSLVSQLTVPSDYSDHSLKTGALSLHNVIENLGKTKEVKSIIIDRKKSQIFIYGKK